MELSQERTPVDGAAHNSRGKRKKHLKRVGETSNQGATIQEPRNGRNENEVLSEVNTRNSSRSAADVYIVNPPPKFVPPRRATRSNAYSSKAYVSGGHTATLQPSGTSNREPQREMVQHPSSSRGIELEETSPPRTMSTPTGIRRSNLPTGSARESPRNARRSEEIVGRGPPIQERGTPVADTRMAIPPQRRADRMLGTSQQPSSVHSWGRERHEPQGTPRRQAIHQPQRNLVGGASSTPVGGASRRRSPSPDTMM